MPVEKFCDLSFVLPPLQLHMFGRECLGQENVCYDKFSLRKGNFSLM